MFIKHTWGTLAEKRVQLNLVCSEWKWVTSQIKLIHTRAPAKSQKIKAHIASFYFDSAAVNVWLSSISVKFVSCHESVWYGNHYPYENQILSFKCTCVECIYKPLWPWVLVTVLFLSFENNLILLCMSQGKNNLIKFPSIMSNSWFDLMVTKKKRTRKASYIH